MRDRITRALFTAAAAGVAITTLGFAAASPAGASPAHHPHPVYFNPSAPQTGTDAQCALAKTGFSNETGTWHASDCGKVGYVATGRTFRFISGVVTIPDHAPLASDPYAYVALDNSAANNDFSRAGIIGGGGTWFAYADIQEPGLPGHHVQVPLSANLEGDGISLSVYLVPTGNSVHVTVTTPDGTAINDTFDVSGPVYTDAQALADWTQAAASSEPAPAPPSTVKTRDLQFEQGRITTVSGDQGTFKGPWSLTAVDATSNGHLPPTGTLIGQPSFLWNDGKSFNNLGNDAFGVWRFPF